MHIYVYSLYVCMCVLKQGPDENLLEGILIKVEKKNRKESRLYTISIIPFFDERTH